jgi:plastocyanin
MGDDMKFSPATLTLAPGDTVEWVVAGAVPHTVTDMPGKAALREHTVLPAGAAPWDSGLLDKGKRYRRVFTVQGAYTYVCLLHEATGMVGTLVVRTLPHPKAK